jgi:hypothetical protein
MLGNQIEHFRDSIPTHFLYISVFSNMAHVLIINNLINYLKNQPPGGQCGPINFVLPQILIFV